MQKMSVPTTSWALRVAWGAVLDANLHPVVISSLRCGQYSANPAHWVLGIATLELVRCHMNRVNWTTVRLPRLLHRRCVQTTSSVHPVQGRWGHRPCRYHPFSGHTSFCSVGRRTWMG